MPKVKLCTWLVMHMKALTGQNMENRGFYDPFRCCFCHHVAETSNHLFIDCVFTQQTWVLILNDLLVSAPVQTETVNLFLNWKLRYPRNHSISPGWSKIWQAIPKFLWCKFALTLNDLIFNNKVTKPEIVAIKAKAMLLEALGNQIKIDSSTVEYQWIGSLQQKKTQKESSKPFIKPKWQMRLPRKKNSKWWKRQNKVSFFFMDCPKETRG